MDHEWLTTVTATRRTWTHQVPVSRNLRGVDVLLVVVHGSVDGGARWLDIWPFGLVCKRLGTGTFTHGYRGL